MIKHFVLFLILSGFTTFAFSQNDWKKGRYYDAKGKVHNGLIKYNYDFKPSITFKESETSKEQIIKSWKSKGFVIEQDSFTVIKNFKMSLGHIIAHDFAQVLEVGSIILLCNYTSMSSGGTEIAGGLGFIPGAINKIETYILTKPNSDKLWVVLSRKKKFKELMKDLTKDFSESSKFKDIDNLSYDMVPKIITEYNRMKNEKTDM